MKVVEQIVYGEPHSSVHCVEVDDPGAPGRGELVIEIEAFPINPADVLALEGKYATRPPLPVVPGAESVARVLAVGAEVQGFAVGDRVIPLSRANWVQRKRLRAQEVVKVPLADPLQLAMLKVNPATAYLMLTRYAELRAGDLVIQNAANSGVGLAVIALARRLGCRTVNVVRRESLAADLTARGADHVFVDGPDLAHRVREAVGDARMPLAIDAVAGASCMRLAECLSDDGIVVNYGLLSGDPCIVHPDRTVFHGIRLVGFWLARELPAMPRDRLESLYAQLVGLVRDGTIATPVEATYPIEEIGAAVGHAAREQRRGKVLVTPNGPVDSASLASSPAPAS
ncbi:MAG: zinc-dependent alcohol dehydrogenase family protein [Burkholderiales bacterium]|nr:MAG: zinc-dependent alcohol dehydrogenase family protein [Burkholderiales bacterium]